MRLERIKVTNFRNLADVDVPLQPGAVIVGENRSGKSNLLYALRLVLDPFLLNSDRQLGVEDFWEGLGDAADGYDPMKAQESIEIVVEFGEIGDDPVALAVLGQALIEVEPPRARLVYRFAPRDVAEPDPEKPVYEWTIHGGAEEDEEEIRGDLRRFLRLHYLSGLRDVERDLASWRRSPLRPLLEAAAAELESDELSAVAATVTEANESVLALDPIAAISDEIDARTTELVGPENATETTLGIASSDPNLLLRALRLYTDEAARPLSTASLGTLNVLYLALLQLALDLEVSSLEAAHVVLAIEEPEAHLHPHVQRLTFRDLLRTPEGHEQSVLVSSHSPHIVSVAPPKSLVVMRRGHDGTSIGVAADADLEPEEWDDIERYLDATRGEMVFARRVLLVEGFVEAVLVPKLARDADVDLDKLGISVCAVHGVHFGSYSRYLTALGTPWAVITDGDPREDGSRAGDARAKRLLSLLELEGEPDAAGIFVGDVTFEPDLALAHEANGVLAAEVLDGNPWNTDNQALIDAWLEGEEIDGDDFLRLVKRFGKARFAQRLANREQVLHPPAHIAAALTFLSE